MSQITLKDWFSNIKTRETQPRVYALLSKNRKTGKVKLGITVDYSLESALTLSTDSTSQSMKGTQVWDIVGFDSMPLKEILKRGVDLPDISSKNDNQGVNDLMRQITEEANVGLLLENAESFTDEEIQLLTEKLNTKLEFNKPSSNRVVEVLRRLIHGSEG